MINIPFEIPRELLGALIALLGVFVTQMIVIVKVKQEEKYKRRDLLRAKYEELGHYFLNTIKKPYDLTSCVSRKELEILAHQEDGNAMYLLAMLYFPKIEKSVGSYVDAYFELCKAVLLIFNELDSRPLIDQLEANEGYIDSADKLMSLRFELKSKIQKYAKEYASLS